LQLAADPALRVPLSSAFDCVVHKPEFEPDREGMLNPGRKYWWRVRARTDEGVWSDWSPIWMFVPNGPGVPVQVGLLPRAADSYRLQWRANPEGRRPVRFIVYAADEQGFTVSDGPYRVNAGNQQARGLFPGRNWVDFPANRLAETAQTHLDLLPRHAFYRVIALDEHGNRSGPSDFTATPRPFIYSQAPTTAAVGVPYRYEAKSIRSIGQLTSRDFPPEEWYQYAFWEPDQPRFSLVTELGRCGNRHPKWLSIDPVTGVLTGIPQQADQGLYQINIQVEIPGVGRHVQSFPLEVRPKAVQ
jgi:hypothetical protein